MPNFTSSVVIYIKPTRCNKDAQAYYLNKCDNDTIGFQISIIYYKSLVKFGHVPAVPEVSHLSKSVSVYYSVRG